VNNHSPSGPVATGANWKALVTIRSQDAGSAEGRPLSMDGA